MLLVVPCRRGAFHFCYYYYVFDVSLLAFLLLEHSAREVPQPRPRLLTTPPHSFVCSCALLSVDMNLCIITNWIAFMYIRVGFTLRLLDSRSAADPRFSIFRPPLPVFSGSPLSPLFVQLCHVYV
jgi:hypothetical protein